MSYLIGLGFLIGLGLWGLALWLMGGDDASGPLPRL